MTGDMLEEAMDLLRLHRQWDRLADDQRSDVIVRGYALFDRWHQERPTNQTIHLRVEA